MRLLSGDDIIGVPILAGYYYYFSVVVVVLSVIYHMGTGKNALVRLVVLGS